MKLDRDRIREGCRRSGMSLSELLRRSGVSRTAFYSLMRRPSVLPESISALAASLGCTEGDLLEPLSAEEVRARARLRTARRICKAHPKTEFENVWHTLAMLEQAPRERLEGSLRRGQRRPVQR